MAQKPSDVYLINLIKLYSHTNSQYQALALIQIFRHFPVLYRHTPLNLDAEIKALNLNL